MRDLALVVDPFSGQYRRRIQSHLWAGEADARSERRAAGAAPKLLLPAGAFVQAFSALWPATYALANLRRNYRRSGEPLGSHFQIDALRLPIGVLRPRLTAQGRAVA